MPIPLAIGFALKAAEHVPGLFRMLKGDKAGSIAEKVVRAAKTFAGDDDPETAVETVMRDPELLKLWITETNQVVVADLEAETEQLRAINATMQAETRSDDPFVRRWRPFFGYVVAVSWGCLMFSAGWVIVDDPAKAPSVLSAIGALTGMWGIALAVLGVSVYQRSKDKQTNIGMAAPGLFGSALKPLKGG